MIHPNAIAYLEKNNREYILISRFLSFALFIACHDYGYFDQSPSVAHMSYIIAAKLCHKNIIFIGQDLAYAENGIRTLKNIKTHQHLKVIYIKK